MLRRRRRLRVVGDSMVPTLADGDLVFVDPRSQSIEDGAVVAARHPTRSGVRIVKRVEFTDESGHLFLRSDHDDAADAADSRTFGPIDPELLVGLVVSRVAG